MNISPYIILTIISLASVIAIYLTLKKKPLCSFNPEFRFNYKPSNWTVTDYSAASVLISVLILAYVAPLIQLGWDLSQGLRWSLLLLTTTSAAVLITSYFRIIDIYTNASTLLNIGAALITLIITLFVTPIVDAQIENITGIEAGKFPAAEKILTFIGVVYCWAYIALFISIVAYPIFFFVLMKKTGHTNLNDPGRRHRVSNQTMALLVLLGLTFFVIIFMNSILEASRTLQRRLISEMLVYGSFHITPDRCDIREMPLDSKIALIGEGKAVLATSSIKDIYRFKVVSCTLPSQTQHAY